MNQVKEINIWNADIAFWLSLFVASLVATVLYFDAIKLMIDVWINMEEYGHGFILPCITAFLIWQKKDILEATKFNGSWYGVALAVLALLLYALGSLSALVTITQYSLFLLILSISLSFMGVKAFKIILVPLCILFFMIPLPNILFNNLSSQLQLISSQIGVFIIRLFDISVYLEGNVIDLGVYKLQVVEACSGLRYLFPLMALSFIAAYFFKGELWKRVIIFLSSIPITVLMNSFRIGVIGVLVEYYGIGMAEGFLHDFEGWAVFMGCMFLLVIEMWVLSHVGKQRMSLADAFGVYMPNDTPENAVVHVRKMPKQFHIITTLVIVFLISTVLMPERNNDTVDLKRKSFSDFPGELLGWTGYKDKIEKKYLDILKLDDYVMINYKNDSAVVNFYSAFYKYQEQGGKAIHSPSSCIPGGGWQIVSSEPYAINNIYINNKPLIVNRLVIQKGEIKQLVYYWFQQRGRVITGEYSVKWYMFWDALTRNRTDGALIRFTTALKPGQNIELADERLQRFVGEVSTIIDEYVPN